ncbi:MAG: aldo/keto reductase [Coriobacteriia bacterium]|nr:aldo/keto reductase [Coriobacteriia bacterium]
MEHIRLGNTSITTPRNAFGVLPIQRVSFDQARSLLRRAVEGGMTFFDTARSYSDSEEKMGYALEDLRERIFIATKTQATTGDSLRADLETSLRNLRTDYVDLYQLHNVEQVFRPGDGTGVYEALLEAKEQGRIRHIGITAHKIALAEEAVESGLYETLQFPFNYLSGPRELALVERCAQVGMGFIAMKGLAGGLLGGRSRAIMAHMLQFPNVVPIWGIQRPEELEEWLGYMAEPPELTPELQEQIDADRAQLQGDFCRSCGYCMPCPQGIQINQAARMGLLLRRMPSDGWLTECWQQEMERITGCTDCRACVGKCPYELDIPNLLRANLDDYRKVLSGERSVS